VILQSELLQGNGSSNNLDGSTAPNTGGFGPSSGHLGEGAAFLGNGHPGENKAKRKRSETKIVRDALYQMGGKKARLVPGESADPPHELGQIPSGQRVERKEEDVIKEAEELLRKGGLGGGLQRGGVAGHFVSGKKSGGQRTVKVTERKALLHQARLGGKPPSSVGIVINSSGLAKIRIGGVTRIIPKGEPGAKLDAYGVPLPKRKGPGRPPNAARLAAQLAAAGGGSDVDLSTKKQLGVEIPTPRATFNADGMVADGMTPTVRSARIKARGPAPDFTDDLDDDFEDEPVKKRGRGRPPSGKMASLAQLPDVREGGQKYKGAKRGRKPKNWVAEDGTVKPARKRGRPASSHAVEFSSKLDEFEKVFKPSVRRTKRPRVGLKEPRSVDFGSPSREFPLVPDSLLMPTFPSVPELMLPSRLQKTRSHSPALGPSLRPRLPLQVSDVTVESFGSVDPQHITVENGRICAIGYRSTWKDPTLGLVHVSEVIAGEDGKPVYTVTCRLKERTDEEERSAEGGRGPFARSTSFQVQRSPRSLIQRSFSLGREPDGRFRASAPSPLGQNQQTTFGQERMLERKVSALEPRIEEDKEMTAVPLEGVVPPKVEAEGEQAPAPQGMALPAEQAWDERPLSATCPDQVESSPPLEVTKALVPVSKEPTISPLLTGKPGPQIEGLKGFDGAADLHDLDTAMIWDEDFHVAFGDVDMPPVRPENGAPIGGFGDVGGGRKSEGQELGWGFGLGVESDKAPGSLWGVTGHVSEQHVSEQEAEEGMLAVFRGTGEGAKMEMEVGPALAEAPADMDEGGGMGFNNEGSDLPTAFQPTGKESPPLKAATFGAPLVPAVQPQHLRGATIQPDAHSDQPSDLLPINTEAPAVPPSPKPLGGSLHIGTQAAPERQESPKAIALNPTPSFEPTGLETSPSQRRPGRPKRLDTRHLPAVTLPDRHLRSERQSQGVETPRTAHRRLTGSDLLVKKGSPEEAWKAYAAAWRETFVARAPQHVEEIDWEEFERDHFGLEKPEVVQ
jgi:hypothetical protein